jgi:hypothetical protein
MHCDAGETCRGGVCEVVNGACTTDPECSPPTEICMAGACVLGCGQPNGVTCENGDVCDTNTGRCVSIRGPCAADPECNPPMEVCEFGQCIPGCTEFGGVQCPGGQQCNPSTGRCTAVGDICLSDLDCSSPSEICNLVSGACDPGCATSGCTSPATCDQATGHCAGAPCSADRLEPNDAFAQGSPGGGLQTQLSICPGDVDFHKFTMNAGDPVTVTVDYVFGEGNIDVELVDSAGTVVAMSNTTGNTESIQYTAAAAGDYAVRVFLARDLGPTPGNTYSINVGVMMAPCPDDSYEDNDSSFFPPFVNAGVTQGLNVCDGDDDYFDVFVDTGEQITVNIDFVNAEGDMDLALLGFLNIPLDISATSNDGESVTYTQEEAGFLTIQVSLYQDAGSMPGNPYTMEIVITPAVPQVCTVDALEENDSMGAAATITPGQRTGLNTCTGDDDFYAVNLSAGDQINATASFTNGEGDIDVQLLDGSGTVLDAAETTANTESVSYTVSAAGTYYIRVFLYGDAGSTTGNTYTLDVSIGGGAQCIVDSFEPNDAMGSAPSMPFGTYPSLGQCGEDDWFAFSLNTNDTISIEVSFTHAEGDIDLELYGPDGTVAARSETTTNLESIAGTSNVTGTFTLRVFLYQDAGALPGNTYDLTLSP